MSDDTSDQKLAGLGARIRALRAGHGLNLHDLALLCGISASALSLIETGQRDLRVSSLYRIAAALRVKPGKLLDDADPPSMQVLTDPSAGYDLTAYK
jgi:Predicted transcriptional regulators